MKSQEQTDKTAKEEIVAAEASKARTTVKESRAEGGRSYIGRTWSCR